MQVLDVISYITYAPIKADCRNEEVLCENTLKTEDCLHTREPTANYLTLRLLIKSLKQGTMFKILVMILLT